MTAKEIIDHILSCHKDMTIEEITIAIERKKAASGGFLTDEAAARLAAAELGVEIKLKKSIPRVYISQLVSGLADVSIYGRVLLINLPKVFPRPNGNGQVARLLIADRTGTIKVVLWDDKAKFSEKTQLGQIVKFSHGYVRCSRNGELELHIGERSQMEGDPIDTKEEDFPYIQDFLERISELRKVRRKTNVRGIVQTMFPLSTFQRKDGTQGKVLRIMLKDETGQIPVVFWDAKAEKMIKAKEGMVVLLMNGNMKRNRRDNLLELHIGDLSAVEIIEMH
jgi:replication factor A1